MTRWAAGFCVTLALIFAAAGCGGGGGNVEVPLTLTLAPTAVTALVGSFVQFTLQPSATIDTLQFLVNDVEGGNGTVGTISTDGLYQAPATIPADTAITVKVKVSNSTTGASAEATATVTLDSGVRVTISPSTFTIGTGETFFFCARVSGVPSSPATSSACNSAPGTDVAVTWSVSGSGSIDAATGQYTAPSDPGSATITAASVYDTARTATAAITVVTATDPTLTSISNTVGAVGAVFQDIYLTGTDFISTTNVFLGGVPVPASAVTRISSTLLRVRVPDFQLLTPTLARAFGVAQQNGTEQACADSTQCQLTLSVQRPALVGASDDSVAQGASTTVDLSGGYFGSPTSPPVVTAKFGSQADSVTVVSAQQLNVAVGGTDVAAPGLVPVTVASNVAGATVGPAVANLAVQPSYLISTIAPVVGSPFPVGTSPSAVALNTATGIAVVANQGSHDITLIDAGAVAPGVDTASLCTGAVGTATTPCTVASAPTAVAVDNLRNIALVANGGTSTVAVVDLATKTVTAIIPAGVTSIADVPMSIGINPLSGRAIVAYQTAGFASIIDLTLPTPAVTGIVAASTGATPHVAVSPKLNWALVTPGGGGTLSIVDLSRQSTNGIASASRKSGIVTIATSSAHTLAINDLVLITGMTDASFDGVFGIADVSGNTFKYVQPGLPDQDSGGGMASYSLPVARLSTSLGPQGVAINDETQKAILLDPTGVGPRGFIFNMLDQSSSSVVTDLASINNIAAAFNPLANIAVVVNTDGTAVVVNPNVPAVLAGSIFAVGTHPVDVAIDPATNRAIIVNRDSNNVSIFDLGTPRTGPQVLQVARQVSAPDLWAPPEVTVESTLSSAVVFSDQTLTVIGSGFVAGTSKVRLDGVMFDPTTVSADGRQLTVSVPATAFTGASPTLSAGPRRYALDVANGTDVSNAAGFTVIQNVDLNGICGSAPAPQSVAIDSRRNLAIVTNPGCNNVAIINLSTGQGQTVLVGTNPQGVAVDPGSGLAVVANQFSNTASIVDVNGNTVVATVNTDPGPTGVAVDPGLGQALVTARSANVLNMFALSSNPDTITSFPVQQQPAAVAVDPVRHLVAVANTGSNTVSLVDLTQAVVTENITTSAFPSAVAFDPVSGAFMVFASLNNRLLIVDPLSRSTTQLRVGINPTSAAYNFASSTLVTTNSSSQTMTVIDFQALRVRAVLSLRSSGRFAVAIHPFTNLAVIADSADNQVILRPLPR
jgi:YVTN family beta-propeller protein